MHGVAPGDFQDTSPVLPMPMGKRGRRCQRQHGCGYPRIMRCNRSLPRLSRVDETAELMTVIRAGHLSYVGQGLSFVLEPMIYTYLSHRGL